tara:strand:+ start:4686 stop:5105 length:420 start_codon:yes stop_codon:yes gene_type:complete
MNNKALTEIQEYESERILKTISKKYFTIDYPGNISNTLLMRRAFNASDETAFRVVGITTALQEGIDIDERREMEELSACLLEDLMDCAFLIYSVNNPNLVHGIINEEKDLLNWLNENDKYCSFFVDSVLELTTVTHYKK